MVKLKEIFKKKAAQPVPANVPASTTAVPQPPAQANTQTLANQPIQEAKVVSRRGLDQEDLDIIAKQGSTKPEIIDPNKAVADGMDVLDVIAPKTLEIDFDYLKINGVYFRTLFVSGYPRFVSPGWLEQIINFDSSLDISFYVYPVEVRGV